MMSRVYPGIYYALTAIAALSVYATYNGALGDQPGQAPKVVPAIYDAAYIPDGFDSNDHVQLVAAGTFQSTCYRPAAPKIEIDQVQKKITLAPQAYFYDGFCLQMLVDWNQVIDLGILKAGDYEIAQNQGGPIQPSERRMAVPLGKLTVRATTTSSPDDFLYAPISQAYVKREGGEPQLTLVGEFRNSCLRLVDVIVNVQRKVITVQPVSDMGGGQLCAQGIYPFEKSVTLPAMPAGKYLLHVRSLNGKAVNNLVDIL